MSELRQRHVAAVAALHLAPGDAPGGPAVPAAAAPRTRRRRLVAILVFSLCALLSLSAEYSDGTVRYARIYDPHVDYYALLSVKPHVEAGGAAVCHSDLFWLPRPPAVCHTNEECARISDAQLVISDEPLERAWLQHRISVLNSSTAIGVWKDAWEAHEVMHKPYTGIWRSAHYDRMVNIHAAISTFSIGSGNWTWLQHAQLYVYMTTIAHRYQASLSLLPWSSWHPLEWMATIRTSVCDMGAAIGLAERGVHRERGDERLWCPHLIGVGWGGLYVQRPGDRPCFSHGQPIFAPSTKHNDDNVPVFVGAGEKAWAYAPLIDRYRDYLLYSRWRRSLHATLRWNTKSWSVVAVMFHLLVIAAIMWWSRRCYRLVDRALGACGCHSGRFPLWLLLLSTALVCHLVEWATGDSTRRLWMTVAMLARTATVAVIGLLFMSILAAWVTLAMLDLAISSAAFCLPCVL